MSRVSICRTSPKSIIEDYRRLLVSTDWKKSRKNLSIILKLNLSWTKFYPACSSPPWQLEGVIKGLLDLGFSPKQIIPVENRTVVTDVYQGAKNHGWDINQNIENIKAKSLTNYYTYIILSKCKS